MSEEQSLPPSPFAKYPGELVLGDTSVDCYVLDTKERVISLRATVKSLSGKEHSDLGGYLSVNALKPYINKYLPTVETIEFSIPGTPLRAKGITAEKFLDICSMYVQAFSDDALNTDTQKTIAIRCSILLASCAKVGLIALIDEATGYQKEREDDALQVKLRAFIAEELREWEKTFPDELWEEFGRLSNWKGQLHSRPKWWGKLVLELIYDALDPDIAKHLKANKPPPRHGQNYHQWLTEDIGLKSLITHIHQVIGIAKTCNNMDELREKVAHYYNKQPMQLAMRLPPIGSTKA
ncbi:MAG: P63C domain-containing protein [Candidatus Contendobacter sp.]|nr:P63C domain-containing protein [Candidatus Contendobacter sp.]